MFRETPSKRPASAPSRRWLPLVAGGIDYVQERADADRAGERPAAVGAARLIEALEVARQRDAARGSLASGALAGGESGIWFCPPSSSQT